MRKFFLSFLLIFVFAVYVIHQKSEQKEVRVIAPNNLPVIFPTISTAQPTSEQSQSLPSPTQAIIPTQAPRGKYKDGQYTGSVADAFYGNIQVKAIISGGKITDVQFLQYPNDRSTSIEINSQAMPFLTSEAIAAQSAQVDIVSGATDSSLAFRESLASALSQAQ